MKKHYPETVKAAGFKAAPVEISDDEKHSKGSSQQRHYSYRNFGVAVKLIAKEHHVTVKAMAERCNTPSAKFSKRLNFVRSIKDHHYRLNSVDQAALCSMLGKACGYEDGFLNPSALVAWAQEHCKMPSGQTWDVEAVSQAKQLDMQQKALDLKTWRQAIYVMCYHGGIDINEITEGIPKQHELVAYIRGNAPSASLNMSPQSKVEKLDLVTKRIGELRGNPNMTPTELIAEARNFAPGKINDPAMDKYINRSDAGEIKR